MKYEDTEYGEVRDRIRDFKQGDPSSYLEGDSTTKRQIGSAPATRKRLPRFAAEVSDSIEDPVVSAATTLEERWLVIPEGLASEHDWKGDFSFELQSLHYELQGPRKIERA